MKELTTKQDLLAEIAALEQRVKTLEVENSNLKEESENYSSLFENHSSIMMLLDPYSLQIFDVNRSAIDFYGYSKKRLCSLSLYDLSTSDKQSFQSEIENARKEHRDYFEMEHQMADGRKRYMEIRSTPIINNSNQMLFAILTDVTMQRKAEKNLIKAKEMIEESDRLKSDFLANMSHEIRTPLNGILGFTDMLKDEDLEKGERNQYVDIINNCGSHLLNLVNNLIDLSQIESGHLMIKNKKTDLLRIFEDLKTRFRDELKRKNKSVDLFFNYFQENELSFLKADPVRIKQVLFNLIENAVKFTDSGVIKFGCTLTNDRVEFYVEDSGIGLSEKDKQEVFKRFTQADTSSSRRYQGSGLGLAVAKGLVDLMDGEMWVFSELNVGSTFSFSIPYEKWVKEDSNGLIENKQDKFGKIWQGKIVLIADNDHSNIDILKSALKRVGFELVFANNGMQAIEMFKKYKPDLVILNEHLPLINGLDVSREIRYFSDSVPVFIEKSTNLVKDKMVYLKAGCTEIISLPIDIVLLYERLEKALH